MKHLAALCVAGFALLLAACSPPQEQRVQLAPAGLQLDLPGAWDLQRTDAQTLLFARPQDSHGQILPSAYLMLVRHPQRQGTAPLDSYVQFAEQQAQRYALRYRRLEDRNVSLAGQPARAQLRRSGGYTREYLALSLMWVEGGYGYELLAAAEPEIFLQLRPRYERALRSLRPLETTP